MNKLKQLEVCGQSPWLDYLKRSLIASGELRTLIERDGLKGVTSNPSIFEKAIGETDEYADALKQFQARTDHAGKRRDRQQRERGLCQSGAEVYSAIGRCMTLVTRVWLYCAPVDAAA
ncbi:MAG: transaldolase family protein [Methylocella sp.]